MEPVRIDTLEDVEVCYRQARDVATQAETRAHQQQRVTDEAARLLAHHLTVLVEQDGIWADHPTRGTTLACARHAVGQWAESRAVASSAWQLFDRAMAAELALVRVVFEKSEELL